MKSISLLSVSLLNEDLISNLIKSCEKFKPKDLTINYIVVENSNETSYRDRICSLAPNVTWVQNSIQDKLVAGAGKTHGCGLNVGMKHVKTDWVFICDNDTLVVSSMFFNEFFDKINEGYSLIGNGFDPGRIGAVIPTGMFVKSCIANQLDLQQNIEKNWDTANSITDYVRKNNLKYYIFRNTFNDSSLVSVTNEPYRSWGESGIDRCLDSDDNVMFLHLGRGTGKSGDLHWKNHRIFDGKRGYDLWLDFCKKLLSNENLLLNKGECTNDF